ncbi:hypothetical protein [Intestinirhabdus alba]|uniref:Uncharacterized protein n=1 Tax=Intestinirhabdus alba TaxID=2899544 RepID=A0A6L6IKB3_9ENTR|nr:hypothetical protein [Intestinirhabdus alba]MTH47281.1 hypothetical protein [Intestinirhabdus alba]
MHIASRGRYRHKAIIMPLLKSSPADNDDDDEMTCRHRVETGGVSINAFKISLLKTGMKNAYGWLSQLNG